MFRSRSWFGGGWGRPKNLHSLEHLKYLYNVLSRNQTVSEHNRGLLVESLRSIAEILIWGDQNDSSVFDFFLEKNMLSFFLRIMRQRSGGGSYVCVQLLQTLNILFENIRNETSLYYLLSNNHVNSIIVHKFDFSDEEVMAYYISFLKTLSLKLNAHTIHFFYNEHTNDFPLYTEAIKFFNHPESMVRIAVRTLTLNVYKVEDVSMLAFIRDRTAAPYFSNIVWFIGKHIQELDSCVRNDADHQSQNRLSDLVAEHLDHLHYLNDILCLNITDLNHVLTDHLLHKLLIPLYIYSLSSNRRRTSSNEVVVQAIGKTSLTPKSSQNSSPKVHDITNGKVSCVVALFLLSQVFLILSHSPLVQTLAWIILKTDRTVFENGVDKLLEYYEKIKERQNSEDEASGSVPSDRESSSSKENIVDEQTNTNVTDEEKQRMVIPADGAGITNFPFLETVYEALDCTENDYAALFGLSLLYAMANNAGITSDITEQVLRPKKSFISKSSSASKDVRYTYNTFLVEKMLQIIIFSCQPSCRVRLVTLELALKLFIQLTVCDGKTVLSESHRNTIETARVQSMALLRNFYKSEEIFLDMFEHEYCDMSKGSLNVEWLCMDSAILLPPTGTPMTGIDFTKRLPCGEVERARRAIRVYFLVRNLVLTLNGEVESQLPLTNPQSCVQIDQALDLSITHNSDLIACTVMYKDGTKMRRFLVIDILQLILVEPDTKRLGWGVAKLVGFLQDIEVTGDKDDSRCLHITIHRPISGASTNRVPLLNAKFLFDDNIRCMAAKQRLTKGRIKARQKKMQHIARLLEIPGQSGPPSPAFAGQGGSYTRSTVRLARIENRALFNINRGPGLAAPRRESSPGVIHRADESIRRHREGESPNRSGNNLKKENGRKDSRSRESSGSRGRSREGSPRMPRPRSEEIPLELIKKAPSSIIDMAPKITIMPRPQTPRTVIECEPSTSSEQLVGAAAKDAIKTEASRETSFIAEENGEGNEESL
ncbi:protein CLEC16A homolog isoform X2 [Diabrotica virgifera virgifera]|uniref:Protein CLEC16A homolog isoform X2 n=1 Tax=Diabrotica virgifera virgifera TaxID=50390 RepID=A0A6P7GT12_DIAVI|nr:protein CLEC16A homolog isoform X2 [Diabrotica virgifera virgifera]